MEREKLSRIIGLRLLSIKEGGECGAIREVVVDVEKKSVEYLVLDTGKGCFGFCVLPNGKIAGIGKDFAITGSSEYVSSIWQEENAMNLAYTDSDLIGARVVSSLGDVIGKVVDFEFQLVEGVIEKYIMEDGGVLPKECIVTLSRGIVFVDASLIGDAPCEEEAHEEEEAEEIAAPVEVLAPVTPVAAQREEEPIVEAVVEEIVPVAVEAAEEAAVEPAVAQDADAGSAATEDPLAARLAALRNRAPAPAAGAQANSDTKNYFERRRIEYVIGKTVKQRITGVDGAVIADVGDTVTEEMVEAIAAANKLTELTMGVG